MIVEDAFVLLLPFLLMLIAELLSEDVGAALYFMAAAAAFLGVAFPAAADYQWLAVVYMGIGMVAMVRGVMVVIDRMEDKGRKRR